MLPVRCLPGVLLLLLGCGPRPGQEPFELLEFRQNELDTVALNEELAFFFSQEIDPGSVTSDSLRIFDSTGRELRGERRVRREALTFLPELPCRADLSDGAFVPGTSYTVILGGFPRPDGLRAQNGSLLSATLKLSFRTAALGGKHALFLAAFPQPFPLRCRGKGYPLMLEDGRIVLEAREAIDPSQVPRAHFELRRGLEPVPARLELVRNEPEYAELQVVPDGPGAGTQRFEPGTYYLGLQPDLRTLGGRALEPAWRSELLTLVVPSRRQRVDFSGERAPELPPDCDGTALARADGSALYVRYPAAAGSGAAGEVVLGASPLVRDLAATRLALPVESTLDLSDWRGPLVLRSQTSLEIGGSLLRRATGPPARPSALAQELRELADRLSDLEPLASSRPPLSAWLARVLASDEDWTILIAGGDLRVPAGGSIQVDGPLVLVAGGWIRVLGLVASDAELWRTPEAAGGFVAHAGARVLPFVLDPPRTNPLVRPFRAGFAKRLGPGLLGVARLAVLPLRATTSMRVEAELVEPTSLVPRLLVRFDLWPRSGEPWLVPESGIELSAEAPTRR